MARDYSGYNATVLHEMAMGDDRTVAAGAKSELEQHDRKHQSKIAYFNLAVAGLAALASLIIAAATVPNLFCGGE